MTADLIPPILGYINQCLNHAVPLVRQKAVMVVHSFVRKDPSCVVELFPDLCRLLLDDDISIVNAVVNTFNTFLSNTLNVRQICDCLPDILSYLKKILNGHCRMEYYHQRVLAPFNLVYTLSLLQSMAPHISDLATNVESHLTQILLAGNLECTVLHQFCMRQ